MKFMMDNSPWTDVTFHAEIDGDGDLMVFANGHRLLFVSSRTGDMCRIEMTDNRRKLLPGLKFDTENRIAVSM